MQVRLDFSSDESFGQSSSSGADALPSSAPLIPVWLIHSFPSVVEPDGLRTSNLAFREKAASADTWPRNLALVDLQNLRKKWRFPGKI